MKPYPFFDAAGNIVPDPNERADVTVIDFDFPVPPDTYEAWRDWKANCGPAALAALLGRTMAQVRHAFPDFPRNPRTNPTQMIAALGAMGAAWSKVATHNRPPSQALPAAFVRGLGFVQWEGPWLTPGVPIGAAYARTHWIAIDGRYRGSEERWYDLNHDEGWLRPEEWRDRVYPRFVDDNPKITGWHFRTLLDLSPPRPWVPPAASASKAA